MFRPKTVSHEEGFTLMEIVVVIGIVAILTSIAIPLFLNQRKVAMSAAVQQEVSNAASFISQNKANLGGYKDYVNGIPGFAASNDIGLRVYGPASLGNKDAACIEGYNLSENPPKPTVTTGSLVQNYYESRWHVTVSSVLNLPMPQGIKYENGTKIVTDKEKVGEVLMGPCQLGAQP